MAKEIHTVTTKDGVKHGFQGPHYGEIVAGVFTLRVQAEVKAMAFQCPAENLWWHKIVRTDESTP